MSARNDLLDAWAAWDAMPGSTRRSNEVIDADAEYAQVLGTTAVHLRDLLAVLRRCEFTREESLDVADYAFAMVT